MTSNTCESLKSGQHGASMQLAIGLSPWSTIENEFLASFRKATGKFLSFRQSFVNETSG